MRICAIFCMSAVLCGCATLERQTSPQENFKKSQAFKNIDGTVQSINRNIIEIFVDIPEADTTGLTFIEKVSLRIVNKSALLEHDEIMIGDQNATITEIRKNIVTLHFVESPKLKIGDRIKIAFHKHIIAVTDFDVIRGHDKSIGSVAMESLTTGLVESGHFNVVERKIIKTVLQELQLGASGLTDPQSANKVGKLVNADIILTGTFADMGGVWNANLRLINVSTGVIVSALEEKATFKEIKPESVRDASNINKFDKDVYDGWQFGYRKYGKKGFSKTSWDSPNDSNKQKLSLRLDYQLGKDIFPGSYNVKKRDWSLYSGLELYAKSDHDEVLRFQIIDANRDDDNKKDVWQYSLNVGSEWRLYRIDFRDLSISGHPHDIELGGDHVLSLDLIERFGFYLSPLFTNPDTSGTFWISELRLY